ncbi:ABC transporter permease [Actinomadura macrotermitis]|uniref:Putative D,D-dipeptide transport system permease protein DdpC n=1 Tax=Actinomadura macrotermitis TaxID=2585200 RepID=A0A7K0BYM8_9ACTN|nr:ABC transporter permease [Actinomadura macrotermitis]MQY06285.1 putative D,D-dipeptide transport system permease protein DdpC [Actinomadura macrotermitis]
MTAPTAAVPALRTAGRRRAAWRPGLWAAGLFLGLVVLAALAPGLLASGAPDAANALAVLRPPSSAHPFGTDANGRDVLTRVIYGVRPSLLAGVGATLLALLSGSALGLLAGLGGRIADAVVMRAVDIVLSLPSLLLALLFLVVTGPGTLPSVLAIALYTMPIYARLVRVQSSVVGRSGYVEAAVSLGLSRTRIVLRHVLPNAFAPLVVLATIEVGAALVAASSLSYLGFGPKPPAPEWGAMLAAGQEYFAVAWWMAVFPGLAISTTVLSITAVGRALQRRSEGRRA